jgi:hypothetical protein
MATLVTLPMTPNITFATTMMTTFFAMAFLFSGIGMRIRFNRTYDIGQLGVEMRTAAAIYALAAVDQRPRNRSGLLR